MIQSRKLNNHSFGRDKEVSADYSSDEYIAERKVAFMYKLGAISAGMVCPLAIYDSEKNVVFEATYRDNMKVSTESIFFRPLTEEEENKIYDNLVVDDISILSMERMTCFVKGNLLFAEVNNKRIVCFVNEEQFGTITFDIRTGKEDVESKARCVVRNVTSFLP